MEGKHFIWHIQHTVLMFKIIIIIIMCMSQLLYLGMQFDFQFLLYPNQDCSTLRLRENENQESFFFNPNFILMFKIITFQSFSKTQRFCMSRESYTLNNYFVLNSFFHNCNIIIAFVNTIIIIVYCYFVSALVKKVLLLVTAFSLHTFNLLVIISLHCSQEKWWS